MEPYGSSDFMFHLTSQKHFHSSILLIRFNHSTDFWSQYISPLPDLHWLLTFIVVTCSLIIVSKVLSLKWRYLLILSNDFFLLLKRVSVTAIVSLLFWIVLWVLVIGTDLRLLNDKLFFYSFLRSNSSLTRVASILHVSNDYSVNVLFLF